MREEGLVVVSLLKIYQKSELQFYKYRLMVGAEMHRPFLLNVKMLSEGIKKFMLRCNNFAFSIL